MPDDDEVFAEVTNMLGANRVTVRCADGVERTARIPGRMQKRIWIRENDIVLVEPWDWQDEKADITWRYENSEAEQLVEDAKRLEEAGCFSLVLEKIPAELAERVTAELSIPTIGIGAGARCDGQVLVTHDMLGLNKEFKPRFLRRYADMHTDMTDAVQRYISDVKSGDFPNEDEQYS